MRIFGDDRIKTAVDAADFVADNGGIGVTDTDQSMAILVNGFNFPDAVSAGSAAYNQNIPVLLTHGDDLSDDTAAALTAQGIDRVLILGGTEAVSAAVETEVETLVTTVDRYFGDFRYDTAVDFAQDFLMAELGWAADNGSGYDLATGEKFADALAAGPHAGTNMYPIVLTPTNAVYQPVADFLATNCEVFDIQVTMGGVLAVSDAVATAHAEAAQCEVTSNQTFTVTPAEEAVNTISTGSLDNTGRHTYTVSGLDPAVDYHVALVSAETVVVDEDGNVSFTSFDLADDTTTSFETVNGTVVATSGGGAETEQLVDVSPTADGDIVFTIDSTEADEVIPVVYLDADNDNVLDLATGTAPTEPTEDFGIGGLKNFVPAEAAATDTGGTTTDVNRNLDYFVAGGDTYYYDSNDAFALNAAPLTMAEFEGLLTEGDIIAVDYEVTEAGQSVFNVTTDVVPAPTNLTATVGNFDGGTTNNDVRITWTASDQPDAVYDVFRSVDADCGTTGDNTQIADNISATTVTDLNVSATTVDRTYCVQAVGSESGATSAFVQATVEVPPAADTTAPFVVEEGAVVDTDTGTNDLADAGDVWVLVFDEDINVSSSAALQVTDGAQSAVVENGVNATFVVDGNVLTITLTTTLTDVNYPADVIAVAGITNDAGLATAIGDWLDIELEDNGPEFMPEPSEVVSATTIALVFNEALLAASVDADCSDFTVAVAGTCTSAAVSADGTTVTLTGTGFDATTTVAIDGVVTDTDGQSTTTQAATTL